MHYPGTYVAGGFDRLVSTVAGRDIVNEDLVNLPNWLPLTFRAGDGPWFDLDAVHLVAYSQELDLRRGVLARLLAFRDRDGREWKLAERRFVSMADKNLAGLEWTLTAKGWSGPVTVRSALDGTVTNAGVPRYRELAGDHLEPVATWRDSAGTTGLVVEDEAVAACASPRRRAHACCSPASRSASASGDWSSARATSRSRFRSTLRAGGAADRREDGRPRPRSRDAPSRSPAMRRVPGSTKSAPFDDALAAHVAAWAAPVAALRHRPRPRR